HRATCPPPTTARPLLSPICPKPSALPKPSWPAIPAPAPPHCARPSAPLRLQGRPRDGWQQPAQDRLGRSAGRLHGPVPCAASAGECGEEPGAPGRTSDRGARTAEAVARNRVRDALQPAAACDLERCGVRL